MLIKDLISIKQKEAIAENKSSDFVATDVSHDPDMIMCLVLGDSEGATNYYGINVLFKKDGKVELGTYDSLADKQAAEHKDEIIKVAKEAVMKDAESKQYMKELGHE